MIITARNYNAMKRDIVSIYEPKQLSYHFRVHTRPAGSRSNHRRKGIKSLRVYLPRFFSFLEKEYEHGRSTIEK